MIKELITIADNFSKAGIENPEIFIQKRSFLDLNHEINTALQFQNMGEAKTIGDVIVINGNYPNSLYIKQLPEIRK